MMYLGVRAVSKECVCVFALQLAIKKWLLAQHQSLYMLVA